MEGAGQGSKDDTYFPIETQSVLMPQEVEKYSNNIKKADEWLITVHSLHLLQCCFAEKLFVPFIWMNYCLLHLYCSGWEGEITTSPLKFNPNQLPHIKSVTAPEHTEACLCYICSYKPDVCALYVSYFMYLMPPILHFFFYMDSSHSFMQDMPCILILLIILRSHTEIGLSCVSKRVFCHLFPVFVSSMQSGRDKCDVVIIQ